MKIKTYLSFLVSAGLLAACGTPNTAYQAVGMNDTFTQARTPAHFNDYVTFLKRKAAGQGVNEQTLQRQLNIHYVEKAVSLDQQQAAKRRAPNTPPPPPNPHGVTHYLNKVLTQAKVDTAVSRWAQYQQPLQQASQTYGVPREYLMALWGMESSFGRYQGNFDVLSVLATLAFEGRRETLFTQEFINALKMLDSGTLSRHEMKGSWAGAMGQTQFMPTSYLKYAADGDHDGKKDIWQNAYDAFASIANYLATVGWDPRLPWGVEVKLAQPMPLSLAGIEPEKRRALREWQQQGVLPASSSDAQQLNALASAPLWLVRPDGEAGRAFLVSNNYRTIMDWNRSNHFAISIGKFADRIREKTR